MRLLAIDPGPVKSAWVVLDAPWEFPLALPAAPEILAKGLEDNRRIINGMDCPHKSAVYKGADHLAIEMVASYGMTAGESMFETCLWIGRFIERWGGPHTKVYRKKPAVTESVCMNLCHNNRAGDSNIRQAILDRYPATGGGKTPQVGTKGQPGPLYGCRADIWAALAVGLTWLDSYKRNRE